LAVSRAAPNSFDFGGLRSVAATVPIERHGADRAAPSESSPFTANQQIRRPRQDAQICR
jgi:hypothetical protein